MSDLTGKRGDRLVIDDPHADLIAATPITDTLAPRPLGRDDAAPVPGGFVRRAVEAVWDDVRDDMVRGFDLAAGPDRSRVALVVAEGSPRLPQIRAALTAAGRGDQLVILSQSGGQVIDALEPTHVRIARAFAVPPDLMFESPPCVSMARAQAEIERRSRLLSARIDEALLSGRGFPTAVEAMRQVTAGLQRFGVALREAGWRWPIQVEEPRLSKRRRRRLRGRTKAARR